MHNFGFLFPGQNAGGKGLPVRNALALVLLCLFVLLNILACSGESAPVENPAKKQSHNDMGFGTIVAVGDSLTAGYGVDETEAYPALLEKRLLADDYFFKVINAGVSGETSSGTLSRIGWVIQSLNPDIIILEIGANDGLRGVDPKVLEKNLDEIVTIVQANGIDILLAGMKMPPNLGPIYTARFAKVYPKIAAKYDIPLIPFFLESVAGEARYNLPDRMHPNPEGYRRILDTIYPHVLEVIKQGPRVQGVEG
jgi:acyl-CoA thioesterase-1